MALLSWNKCSVHACLSEDDARNCCQLGHDQGIEIRNGADQMEIKYILQMPHRDKG